MPGLLLFDIDGTLVHTSATRHALRRVFQMWYGVPDIDRRLDLVGCTDSSLFPTALSVIGHSNDSLADIHAAYLDCLAVELDANPGRALPGVRELLVRLSGDDRWYLALGTGNLRQAAMMKLAAHQLDTFFPAGGFGEDGIQREEILLTAVRRAKDHFSASFKSVVVVGDTPNDVSAARRIGAKSLAVATGWPDEQELRKSEANALVRDLSRTDEIMTLLVRLGV